MDTIVIGTGELWWPSAERHTDRYGVVHLNRDDGTARQIDTSLVGRHGRLVAVFPDGHTTDPTIAAGHTVELGVGTLFVEPSRDGHTEVGVKPDDGRADHWLDGKALTLCDGQLVRLELHPSPLKVGEFKIVFRKAAPGSEWAVFITRTTTQVVEVRVPDAELDYAHDPNSLKGLERALKERAMEKNLRGETLRVVGPVHEIETTTWELVGPAADEARAGLITRYTGDDEAAAT